MVKESFNFFTGGGLKTYLTKAGEVALEGLAEHLMSKGIRRASMN